MNFSWDLNKRASSIRWPLGSSTKRGFACIEIQCLPVDAYLSPRPVIPQEGLPLGQ